MITFALGLKACCVFCFPLFGKPQAFQELDFFKEFITDEDFI